jgi:hypothetical protein
MNPNRTTRLLAAVGTLFLLAAAAVALVVPPASGYEISIYAAYPWYFWAAIVGAIFVGQLVMLSSAADDSESHTGTFGLLLSLAAVVTLTLLPYLRGYPVYGRGDVLTHLGLIRDLRTYGTVGNIYPPMHLLVEALAGATGLEPVTLINFLPMVFTAVFLGSMYRLVVVITDDRRRAMFAAPFVLFPVLGSSHVIAVPFTLSLLLTPFALYLLVLERRTSTIPVRVMLLLGVIGVVLFHPLTGLFLMFVLLLYAGTERVLAAGYPSQSPSSVASFTVAVFAGWYLSFVGILIRFRNIVDDFLRQRSSESQLEGTVNTVERTGADLADVVRIAVLQYGDAAILYGFATTFVAGMALRWSLGRLQPGRFTPLFGATTLLFIGASVVFLTNDLIVGFGRPLGFGTIFAAALAGWFWYALWQRTDHGAAKSAFAVGIGAVLLLLVLLSVASMFSSPPVAQTNQQVTQMELDGMEWTLENRNDELLIEEFGITQFRHYQMRNGIEDPSPTVRREETRPPDHFNYTTYETLGRSYETDTYLVLSRLGRITYPAKFPDYRDQWRFTPGDFARLEHDPSVASIYDNGEFDAYWISADTNRTAASVEPGARSHQEPRGQRSAPNRRAA